MRLLKKVIIATMIASVVCGSMPIGVYQAAAQEPTDITVSNVTYKFENDKAGYADGSITVTASADAKFELYWGNSAGEKMQRDGVFYSSLGSVTTINGTGTYDIISDYTAIPEGVSKLLVYNGDEKEYTYDIPQNKVFNKGTVKYKYGILSDIHYNRYNASGSDDAFSAFNKALTFMEKTAKVSFVGGLGDLSNRSEDASFKSYSDELSKHNLTMYTCMGNHDVYNADGWKKYINTDIQSKNAKSKGILNVADNGLDFVYQNSASTEDVFIFLSQTRWLYNSPAATLLTDEQLYWLEEMLVAYADKNVYLFFHTYVANNDGNTEKCVGNLKNPGGYSYDLTYTFGAKDEKKMRKLLQKYSNVTMFGGHSHWSYSMQIYNENLNIGTLGTGATLVHVSSVTSPRSIGKNDSERTDLNNQASEGMVADIYNDCVVYTGVDIWNNEYEAYATYIAEKGAKTTAEKIKVPVKAKIKSAVKTNKKAKKAKIRLKKIKGALGYEIAYSTTKKFKAKKTTVKKTKKTTYTIKKLKAGKTYYVRARAYIKKYGKYRYGKWSKAKKITVKKK